MIRSKLVSFSKITIVLLMFLVIFPLCYSQDTLITNSVGMKLKIIRAGTFMMGHEDGGIMEFEKPVHEVTLTYDFYMGIYLVTQAEYEAVMGENPSYFKGSNRPVENMTFPELYEFCRRLSEKEGVTYRLPYEAEYEYALRAGTTTDYYWGDDLSEADAYIWYAGNSNAETHPVGQKKPNKWGLYDMVGNVCIPTEDNFGFFKPEPVTDPKGPDKPWGTLNCVARSCDWETEKRHLDLMARSSLRHGWNKDPNYRSKAIGFRVVREVK